MLKGKSSKKCEVFNLGSGQGVTVLEAIRAFEKISGLSLNYTIGPRRPGDVISIFANNDLARTELGWIPKFSLDEMIGTAWKWEQKIKIDESFYNSKFSELN